MAEKVGRQYWKTKTERDRCFVGSRILLC